MTPRVAQYVREEADRYGVRPDDIMSRRRYRKMVLARQAVMCRLRADGYSYPLIGYWMKRDHSTVVYAVKKACG